MAPSDEKHDHESSPSTAAIQAPSDVAPESVLEKAPEAAPAPATESSPETTADATTTLQQESTPESSPEASPEASPKLSPTTVQNASPESSPVVSPEASPVASLEASPKVAPISVQNVVAEPSTELLPEDSPEPSPQASPSLSAETVRNASPEPAQSAESSPVASPHLSPRASPEASPESSPEASPQASPRQSLASPRPSLASPRPLASPRDSIASPRTSLASPRASLASPRTSLASPRGSVDSSTASPASPRASLASPRPSLESVPRASLEATSEATPPVAPETISAPPTPDEDAETPTMTHDSMVTVRLSEPPALTLDTDVALNGADSQTKETQPPQDGGSKSDPDVVSKIGTETRESVVSVDTARSLRDELAGNASDRDSVHSSDDEVNWAKLEKTEDEQTKDEETDNSTTLLLQRLEQENAKLATNPKTVKVEVANQSTSKKPRPPSMAQLRQMVDEPPSADLRYSMLPPPPPMTDLEFWAALVKDFHQTAERLPTLLSNKIHKGIPPPLRGVVWQSMSGARDTALEEQYERFCGESSPHEFLIGKDVGRSFPGVDMFQDPEGDGQRMLGRVLKVFSLYDTKIGYCQGLAFLVGPLLMHMPDKQAFCVLVRLMEHYDLRTCFQPDLSGLHIRIYQFRELMKSNLPTLSTHFEKLQVDPAYVSQWFLSFFAVTCPLPMLFRIYDVIFAEGASETLMRVALSLMRKNEERLLACEELEDAMQLLLSRGLWDCYHYDADEFVDDFVSLTSEVSRENLGQLEKRYRDSQVAAPSTIRTSDITKVASRFLGRIWPSASSISPKPPSTLSPDSKTQRQSAKTLRRSTSKQSIASTLNSMEASSVSVTSSVSTDASDVSRESSQTGDESSSRESTPVGLGVKSMASTKTVDERYLHSQIEDLLTAMGELQRDQAILNNELQREREEREEDQKAVQPLLEAIQNQETSDESTPEILELAEQVQTRFVKEDKPNRSSMLLSKAQLREELVQTKEQLSNSRSHAQEYNRRVNDLDSEVSSLKEQLRESHARVRNLHQDNQRLEKQARLKPKAKTALGAGLEADQDMEALSKSPKGLRELKLSRSVSTPSQADAFNKRLSSLPLRNRESAISLMSLGTPATPGTPVGELSAPSASDYETVLVELAQCKTAEAIAKQEAEEAKQRLESFRKAYGIPPGDTPPVQSAGTAAMNAVGGVFGRLTGQTPAATTTATPAATPAAEGNNTTSQPAVNHKPAASTGGGFWGWRR